MNDNPKVSIIVPVYNVEPYLRKCLDSIMGQTFTDFEAVLVDDGSTDNSGRICDEYAKQDPRFVVVHKQNEGVAKARVTAFEHSRGELITFIDADDYVAPEYLEKLSRPVLEDGADMVSCDYYVVENQVVKENPAKCTGLFDKQGISDFIARHYFYDGKCKGYGMTCFLCTKMVKRQYVKQALANGVGMWFGEDQIALFTMLQNINSLCLIPDRLYYYVRYSEQTTKKYDYSLWESIITMLEKYRDLDVQGVAREGLRKRTWLYIRKTISQKMVPAGLDRDTFVNHLRKMSNTQYMKDFFMPLFFNTGFELKDYIKYLLLKFRMFRVYCSLSM